MRTPQGQRTVFTRLMAMQLVSVCISLLILGVLFGYLVQEYFSGVSEWDLMEQGARTLRAVHSSIIDYDWVRVREQFYTLAESSDITLWAMDGYGQVMAGSLLEAEDLSLTLERAEIAHVLAGNRIVKKVMGPQYQNLLVVMPVREELGNAESPVVGALAMRAPLGDVWGTINQLLRIILVSAAGAGAVVILMSYRLARGFAKPLEDLKIAAIDIAHGRFRQLPVPTHSNEVDHLVSSFNYASQQIEQAAHERERLDQLRREFLSAVSHELRGPLTSLKGFLELMEQPLSAEQKEKYHRIMMEDTGYLERLVEDVLELSKMETGTFSLQRETVDIPSLLQDSIERMQPMLDEYAMRVELDNQCGGRCSASVDAQRMHQVFINLLRNAVQHSPRGSDITMTLRMQQDMVCVDVQDHGSGIPAQALPHIWERFYKMDAARTRGQRGSGLGLAVVKEIVEAHGGTVGVDSVEGQGTCFHIQFPNYLAQGGETD